LGARYTYAKSVARKILKDLDINNTSVSVIDIANKLGIDIYEYDKMANSISALLDYKNKVILVNPTHSDVRKRFSIAHELGHYCLEHYDDQRSYLKTLENNNDEIVFKEYAKDQEIEANEFAAELLMPEQFVKKYFYTTSNAKKLAEQFQVSSDAMWVRLSRLKLIDYSYNSRKN
jgi:Zn-dependent peptidase ImmA (M78 family)